VDVHCSETHVWYYCLLSGVVVVVVVVICCGCLMFVIYLYDVDVDVDDDDDKAQVLAGGKWWDPLEWGLISSATMGLCISRHGFTNL